MTDGDLIIALKDECNHLRASRDAHKATLKLSTTLIEDIYKLSKTIKNKKLDALLNKYYDERIK